MRITVHFHVSEVTLLGGKLRGGCLRGLVHMSGMRCCFAWVPARPTFGNVVINRTVPREDNWSLDPSREGSADQRQVICEEGRAMTKAAKATHCATWSSVAPMKRYSLSNNC